jgi:TolB protein
VTDAAPTVSLAETDHPALDALPAWSPNGKQLVFVSDRIGRGQRLLHVMNVDGTGIRPLTRGAYDMSPDWFRG